MEQVITGSASKIIGKEFDRSKKKKITSRLLLYQTDNVVLWNISDFSRTKRKSVASYTFDISRQTVLTILAGLS